MTWMDYLAIMSLTALIVVLVLKLVNRAEPALSQVLRDVDGEALLPAPVTATSPITIHTRR